jgi:WSC domain
VYQMDLLDSQKNVTRLAVTDARPVSVAVDVKLASGLRSSVQVALDTASVPKALNALGMTSYTYATELSSKLPSRIHVHATAPVCVKQVDLYLKNETGHSHLAFSLPASALAECEGMNVCSKDDESKCSQSLMYYDKVNKCALLQPNTVIVPRDLSLKLFTTACGRLTTWSHPSLGKPMVLQVDYSFTPSAPIEVYARAGIGHKYSFASGEATQRTITESNRIPLEYTLSGGSGARVNAIRISRYGLNLASVQFSMLWDCIQVCKAVADSTGLVLADNRTKLAYVKLVDAVECNKLEGIYTYSTTENDTITSTDACTTPPMDLRNLASVSQELANLRTSNSTYRTLKVIVTSFARYQGNMTVEIAPNRGLTMETDTGVSGTTAATIRGVHFILNRLSELTLDGLTLSGFTKIEVPKLATFEGAGCTIEKQITSGDTLLVNEGKSYIANSKVKKDSRLVNLPGGRLQMTYVEFSENSRIVTDTSNETDLVVSRLQLYDTFDLPSHITLPDARRFYTVVDEEGSLCNGADEGTAFVSTNDLNAFDCENLCEELDLCSGFMTYTVNDADDEPQCDVCVKDNKACSLNCSKGVVSLYKKAESHFDYTKIVACPFLERNLRDFDGVSLEECKMLCSYYASCEGFEYSVGAGAIPSRCQLVADLDFSSDTTCSSQSRPFYIPFVVGYTEGFVSVPGTLLPAAAMSAHVGLGLDECAAACKKTVGCSSYISRIQGSTTLCTLHDDNRFIRSANETGLFVGVSDIFPKNRYMKLESCFSQASSASSSVQKTEEHCQVACGQDLSCAALVFLPFTSHFVKNCFLYSRNDLIDSLFNPDVSCTGSETVVTVAYSVDTFEVSSGRLFVPFLTLTADILLDECKALCLQELGCVAFSHSASTFECVLGDLSEGESNSTFLALSAGTVDTKSKYLSNVVCYSGEPLQSVVPEFVEDSQGFARWPRTCSGNSAVVGSPSNVLSPAECGLLCSLSADCIGFNHFVNYGGTQNLNKIGRCELLGGTVVFDDCDAVDLNMDTYLRPKDFSTCEALCNTHQLCSSFIVDNEVGCLLFSDIALTKCEENETPRLVHTSLSYLERDAMIKVPGQCFVEFEDVAAIGCFSSYVEDMTDNGLAFLLTLPTSISTTMTPFLCQHLCLENRSTFYALAEGDRCLCSDFEFYSELESSTNCSVACPGDSGQKCGGQGSVQVGSTNLPVQDITLAEVRVSFGAEESIFLR